MWRLDDLGAAGWFALNLGALLAVLVLAFWTPPGEVGGSSDHEKGLHLILSVRSIDA